MQGGEFHADLLEGRGVERVGERERYEGGFRGGKRNGYGQVTDAERQDAIRAGGPTESVDRNQRLES